MSEDVQLKIKTSYKFDQFLMYLIQDVTKKPSAEILNFFYELTNQVAQIGFKAKKKEIYAGIDKKIDDYFPGTSIPFHMRLRGNHSRPYYGYHPTPEEDDSKDTYNCRVEVGFPDRSTYLKEEELTAAATAIMEYHLLGGDAVDVAPFERPVQSSGKLYKKLMDSFAGRPEPEKKPRKKKGQ